MIIAGVKTNKSDAGVGAYPYCPLALCLPIAEAVSALGGIKTAVSKGILASQMKENERAQTFTLKIASAKSFGMIIGRSSFLLTEAGKRFFYPEAASDKRQALLEFLCSPPSFQHVLDRFDGSKLPPGEILGNILHKESEVPVSWKDRVAGFFIRSAQFAEVVDAGGVLRFRAAREGGFRLSANSLDGSDMQPLSEKTSPPTSSVATASNTVKEKTASDCNVWTFTHQGGTVRVETPTEISVELWKKLDAYVKLLQPNKT